MRLTQAVNTSRRDGYTLIEISAVLWAYSILLLTGGVLVHTILKTRSVAEQVNDNLIQTANLASIFRADVAAATAMPDRFNQWVPGPSVLILTTPEGTVVYEAQLGQVVRNLITIDQQFKAPYPISPKFSARFSNQNEQGLVTLRLSENESDHVGRTLIIAAAVGRDHQ